MTFARRIVFLSLFEPFNSFICLVYVIHIPICMKVTSLQRRVFSKVENKNKKKNEEEAEEKHACFDLKTYIMRALGCIGWLAVLI